MNPVPAFCSTQPPRPGELPPERLKEVEHDLRAPVRCEALERRRATQICTLGQRLRLSLADQFNHLRVNPGIVNQLSVHCFGTPLR
mgnify:FL=1